MCRVCAGRAVGLGMGVTGCSRGDVLVRAQGLDLRVCRVSHVCAVPHTPRGALMLCVPDVWPQHYLVPRQPLVLGHREGRSPTGFWVIPWALVPALAGPGAVWGLAPPLSPRSTRARLARVLQDQRCHEDEETSAGLSSAESGQLGRGHPSLSLHPPFPHSWS